MESGTVKTLHDFDFLSINDLMGSGTPEALQTYGSSS